MVVDELKVNEIFGLTVQGEGPSIGRVVAFLRLYNCNQTCTWCDTYQTWANTPNKASKHQLRLLVPRETEEHRYTVDQVVEKLLSFPWPKGRRPKVVISGGEPMLQQPGIVAVMTDPRLIDAHFEWEIETAGTIATIADLASLADAGLLRFNISPKLASSGNELRVRRNLDALRELMTFQGSAFKFVVCSLEDLEEVDELVDLVGMSLDSVFLMPEGTRPDEIVHGMQDIVEDAIKRGYNLTTRMHTLIWGDERGR